MAANKIFRRLVDNKQVVTSTSAITTTAPSIYTNDKGYPSGEELFRALNLRVYGDLDLATSDAGNAAAVAQGALKNLRAFTLETDKHGIIVNGIDGLALARIQQFRDGTFPQSEDIATLTTGNPTFSFGIKIPFGMKYLMRDLDTCLDMKQARVTTRAQFGIFSDLFAVGTATYSTKSIRNLAVQQTAEVYVPANGAVDPQDLPLFMPSLEKIVRPISASATGYKIELPYGDRVIDKIFIAQRNSSSLAELDNSILAKTGQVRLEVNSIPWVNNIQWGDVQAENKAAYGLETMPSGWGVLDFGKTGKISEMLNVIDKSVGTLNLFLDVTTGSNYELDVYVLSYKPLPPGAVRAQAGQ